MVLLKKIIVDGLLSALLVLMPWGLSQAQTRLERPRRVASLNLCADQFLLALADPQQIVSLSPLARDPSLSFFAAQAVNFPVNGGTAETLIDLNVDLVLMGSFEAAAKQRLLSRQNISIETISPWVNFAVGREEIRRIAARLGHRERGEVLIAAIDEALRRTKGIALKPYRVMTIYRRGYVPAENAMINVLLKHFGLTLHQSVLGLKRDGLVRLEALVADPPDYAVVDEVTGSAIDNGSAMLIHPALMRALPPEKRLILLDNLFLCDGPSTPAAINQLANEVNRKIH